MYALASCLRSGGQTKEAVEVYNRLYDVTLATQVGISERMRVGDALGSVPECVVQFDIDHTCKERVALVLSNRIQSQ